MHTIGLLLERDPERSCANDNLKSDEDSSKSHRALGAANDGETKVVVIGDEINECRGQMAARQRCRRVRVGCIIPAGCDSQHQIAGSD
jgi:hypothetical protein